MFADPQSVTYNAVVTSMPRLQTGPGRAATYQNAAGDLTLTISHANGKRERSSVRLQHTKVTADPLFPSQNKPYDAAVYLVVDRPLNIGYSDTEIGYIYDALTGLITPAGFKTKFFAQES